MTWLPIWLPIESAPEDGTKILLSDYLIISHGFIEDGLIHIIGFPNVRSARNYTLWHPLPELPKEEKKLTWQDEADAAVYEIERNKR